MNLVARLVSVALAMVVVFEVKAFASPTFPDHIKESLSATRAPACTICHTTPTGGFGTANTEFAMFMRSRGLKPADFGSLDIALAAAQGENSDVNRDGVSDIVALRAGLDPNAEASATGDGGVVGADVPAEQTYGCQARIEPRGVADPSPIWALTCIWLLRKRRRP